MVIFNNETTRLKYIDAEVDIFKNGLDYLYGKRKISLRDKIKNNIFY